MTERNRGHLRRWLPWLDATRTVDDTLGFIRTTEAQHAAGRGAQFAIVAGGKTVGVAGFHALDLANRCGEVGYWLAAAAQGRGIMTRAVRTLIDHGFRAHGLNRIAIHAEPDNRASCAVAERLGLIEEGILRQAGWLYDHYVDHVVYAVLRDEWRPGGG